MIYNTILSRTPIDYGWSGDRKFRAVTQAGQVYFLRISPFGKQDRVAAQFHRMTEVASLGIPMCLPIEQGSCDEGAYVLHSWIEGEDVESALPGLDLDRQYAYGLDAGRILRQIHTLPAPSDLEPWEIKFNRKLDRKLQMYADCPLKYPGGEAFIRNIQNTRHLLKERPQCYQHGDFHSGNMMIDQRGTLTIIDFDRDDYGDPWEEFNRIVWCAQLSAQFASGLLDGYFDREVPLEFWQLLSLYLSANALGSLPWSIPYGPSEVQVMQDQAVQILRWYDNFHRVIPSWYGK